MLERGREGERKGEKHQCVVACKCHAPPTGDLARNPGLEYKNPPVKWRILAFDFCPYKLKWKAFQLNCNKVGRKILKDYLLFSI